MEEMDQKTIKASKSNKIGDQPPRAQEAKPTVSWSDQTEPNKENVANMNNIISVPEVKNIRDNMYPTYRPALRSQPPPPSVDLDTDGHNDVPSHAGFSDEENLESDVHEWQEFSRDMDTNSHLEVQVERAQRQVEPQSNFQVEDSVQVEEFNQDNVMMKLLSQMSQRFSDFEDRILNSLEKIEKQFDQLEEVHFHLEFKLKII